jgi:ribosomal protein L11 methyltransferase
VREPGKEALNMADQHAKAEVKKDDWLKIELFAPVEMIDALTNFVMEIGAQGSFQESLEPLSPNDFPASASGETLKAFLPCDVRLKQRITALQTYIDGLAQLFPELEKPHFRTESIHDPDWGEAWKKYFKPLRVSRNIVIKPTWERFSPTGRDIVIEIDPGMAFGTGQHPSTRMCLEAIEEILLRDRTVDRWRVLDVGTGTGILGIACAKLDAEEVLCVDIDQKAVEVAAENARINQVDDRVEIRYCDVATLTEPYHLIVANITAKILIKLRSHLVRLLRPGGYLVISGIIEQNKPDIEAHFPGDAFPVHRLITEKEWLCYVLRKESGRP